MSLPKRLLNQFQDLAKQPEEDFDLFACLMLISKILTPSGNIPDAQSAIDDLTSRLQTRYDLLKEDHDPLDAKVLALQYVMVREEGFYGDPEAYDDLDHMNMFRVLDYKCATATTLSILFLHCCHQCGWSVNAIGFPGYHMIVINEGAQRAIIDPFEKCARLYAPDLRQLLKVLGGAEAELTPSFYDVIPDKTLAIRHLNTVKIYFVRCNKIEQALDILQCLTVLAPDSASFWRESGLLNARIGQLNIAIQALNESLTHTEDAETQRHTRRIIDDLQDGIKN